MSTYGFLVLCIQACLIQNALGQLLNRGVGRNGLEVDVSRRSGLGNVGLNNFGVSSGLTNFGGRGLSLNNVGSKTIGLNSLDARGIGLNNLGDRGIGNNIGLSGLSVGNRGYSGELNNAALLGGSKYGVADVAAVSGVPVTGPFVSNGGGEIVVGGEFAAAGTTLVAGQLPVLGAVGFSGTIPTRGVVSIAGECGCSRIPL